MVKTGERALAQLPPDAHTRTRFFASVACGEGLIFSGEDAERGADLIRVAVDGMPWSDDWIDEPRLLAWAAMAPLWLREGDVGRALLDRAVASAREHATIGALPLLLSHVAIGHVAADDWSAGRATYDEAMRLARETGQRTELAGCLARRAWLEARQGKEEEARAHAAEARALAAELQLGLVELWALQALGDLELGFGRPALGVERLEELDRHLETHGIGDVDVSPAPELVDAYLRLGRRDDAVAAAASFAERARAKGQPWALARAARANGLVAGDPGFVEPFEEALRLHELTPDLFEMGRTRLAYGSRLRRARQRVRARAELREAIEAFDRLGATPWLELAASELAATGETARRRDPSTRDELTPQELQICLLLAEGNTTREAAAALFLSPKTIEYHLRNAYRKLGISSREELALAVRR
jgi:DNA-binding CsgD family transcriptional regulator